MNRTDYNILAATECLTDWLSDTLTDWPADWRTNPQYPVSVDGKTDPE